MENKFSGFTGTDNLFKILQIILVPFIPGYPQGTGSACTSRCTHFIKYSNNNV